MASDWASVFVSDSSLEFRVCPVAQRLHPSQPLFVEAPAPSSPRVSGVFSHRSEVAPIHESTAIGVSSNRGSSCVALLVTSLPPGSLT